MDLAAKRLEVLERAAAFEPFAAQLAQVRGLSVYRVRPYELC